MVQEYSGSFANLILYRYALIEGIDVILLETEYVLAGVLIFGCSVSQNMYDYGMVLVPDAAEGRAFDLIPMMPGEDMNFHVYKIWCSTREARVYHVRFILLMNNKLCLEKR